MRFKNVMMGWPVALAACAMLAATQGASAQVNENFDSTGLGSLPAGWSSTTTGAGAPWSVVDTASHSSANSVFTIDPATTSTSTLTLPAVTATAAGPVTLDFWRRLDTEASSITSGFDGVRVQVSINGAAFVNIDNRAWLLNGYTVLSISSAGAVPHFSHQLPIWTHTIGTVFAAAGETVQFQFILSTDGSVGRAGAWIDDVSVTSAAGGSCCDSTGVCTIRTAADCGSNVFSVGSSCTTAPCAVIANDTCSGAVPLALMVPTLGSNFGATNDYQLTAAAPPFSGLVQTTTTAPGRDSVYTFTPGATGNYSFRLTFATISTMAYGTAQNMVLYVANACPAGAPPITIPTANILAASNRNSLTVNGSEELHCVPLVAGTQYWIYADQLALLNGSTFYLEVFPCATETESNDTPAAANTYAFGNSGMEGTISPVAEVDFYSLGTPEVGSRVFALVDGNASSINTILIKVTTDTDTLEADSANADGPFGGSSSLVAGTPLTGTPSFIRISGSSTTTLYQPYRLYAAVQPPLNSAVVETEPNDDTAQANADASNYFSGAVSASADTDTYSFLAAEGALIFAALDCDPLRDNTPFNGGLELWDSAGNVLAFANDTATTSSVTSGAGVLTATTPNSPGEALVWRARTTGTYFVRVRTGAIQPNTTGATVTAPTGDYLLSITLANNNLGDGACCNTSGGCAVVAGTSCLSPSLFQGVGSACNAGLCPSSVGACCLTSGGCSYVLATACNAPSAFQGSNSTCAAVTCPAAGSCCSGPACSRTLSTTCSGSFTTGGTCTINLCAASCCDNGTCTLVVAAGPCAGTLGAPGSVCIAGLCPPDNDTCTGAILLGVPAGVAAQALDARGATPDVGLTCNTAGFTASTTAGVWYKVVVPAGDDYTMTLGDAATTDAVWGVFTGTCGTLSPVGCFAADAANNFPVVAGQTYYILLGVQGTTAQPTLNPTYNVTISFAVATGACCNGTVCTISAASACTGLYMGVNSSCAGGPNASESPAVAIPDAIEAVPTSIGTVTRTLAVSGSGTVSDIAVTVGIVHLFVGDVRIRLAAPNGAAADLLARPSGTTAAPVCPALFGIGNGNDINGTYTFTDSAATGINAAALANLVLPSGSYRAQGCTNTLVDLNTVFAGAPVAGIWTLTVTDEDGAVVGTLNSWSLTINGGTAPPCSLVGTCCVGAACSVVAASGACAGTFTLGDTTCTPTTCGGAGGGVCCRGSTCTTTFASAAACTAGLSGNLLAGASFNAAVAACNTAPCCYANYNQTNGIEIDDIFAFLNDWLSGSSFANFGGNGTTGTLSIDNIFNFINAWLAGGC